jgi:hypothetical protein
MSLKFSSKLYINKGRFHPITEIVMEKVSSDQVVSVEFKDGSVFLRLDDGRVIGNPLDWHDWLAKATPRQRDNVEMYELAVYWPDLDEGLDVAEMMKGQPPRLSREKKFASP